MAGLAPSEQPRIASKAPVTRASWMSRSFGDERARESRPSLIIALGNLFSMMYSFFGS
jgi:hypothetical protein